MLAYRERVRVAPDATISDPAIAQRVSDFVTRCRALRDARTAPGRLPFWLLRDMASLRFRAQRGDPWAVAAQIFLRRGMKATFPIPSGSAHA